MSHPDHFALFSLPVRFKLDEGALERAHKDVQSRIHPDRFASSGAAERRVAMQWAARANEAYRILKSPLARAAYLCELAGAAIDASSNTAMPVDFLAQQMEWREALEQAQGSADTARLASLDAEIKDEHDRLIGDIEAALDARGDHAAAAKLVRQLMFVDRFRDELRVALDAFSVHQASA